MSMNNSQNLVNSIALTGGPCAGKTTMLSFLGEWLIKQGMIPIFIDEVATRLQKNGITPTTGSLGVDKFEKILLKMQLSDEEIYRNVALEIAENTGKRVVIIQDRSIVDIAAYIGMENLNKYLKEQNRNLQEETDKFSAAIHLVTAASGAIQAYTTENNAARMETPDEAAARDQQTFDVYLQSMPKGKLFRIANNGSFQRKKLDTLNAVNTVLKLPLIGEQQRKYLINLSDIEKIKKTYGGTVVSIEQIYLKGTEIFTERDEERRIRKVSDDKNCFYSISHTRYSEGFKERIKTEKMLTEDEYNKQMENSASRFNKIRKKRICFMHEGEYIEIDVFDKPHFPYGILEIKSLEESITKPTIEGIGEEVTGKAEYLNRYIALK